MLTAEHKQLRRGKIGGTLMGAILGCDPRKSPYDAYLELRGEVEDVEANEAMDAGTRLEGVVLDWAEGQLGCEIRRDVFIGNDPLCANIDGIADDLSDGPAIVESKTTGLTGPPDPAFDPAADDDQGLPDRVIVQVQHYMGVAGRKYRRAFVPVLIGGHGFKMFRVGRSDELIEVMRQKAADFYTSHVMLGIPPTDSLPSIDVLKRIRRQPEKTVPLADELVDEWIAAKAAKKQAEDDCEAAQVRLLAAMGDAEGGTYSRGMVTYLETHRRAYEVAETTYRQLRIKKAKGA